jgi:hypothetical protein
MTVMTDGTTFARACRAIEEVVSRLTDMLRRNRGVTATAVGTWTLPEVAAHISHVIVKDTDALIGGPLPDSELSPAAVRVLTAEMLNDDPERDPNILADRIDALGAAFVALSASPPTEPVTWLGGIQLPPSAVACHLLEELLMHGFDIASAARAPWPIAPAHAALAITGAALPIIAASPQSWVRPGSDSRVRARVEFRLRGFDRFVLALDNGPRVEFPPANSRADAYVSAAPADLLLVMLGRQSHWRALRRGKVMVWGRRPQSLLALLRNISPP